MGMFSWIRRFAMPLRDPPRQCASNADYGFERLARPDCIRILINGDLKRGVIAYDQDAGWADVVLWDDHGQPVWKDGDYCRTRYHGDIRVEWKEL
jgi:hypothetical protein